MINYFCIYFLVFIIQAVIKFVIRIDINPFLTSLLNSIDFFISVPKDKIDLILMCFNLDGIVLVISGICTFCVIIKFFMTGEISFKR